VTFATEERGFHGFVEADLVDQEVTDMGAFVCIAPLKVGAPNSIVTLKIAR
jgi:hypothetical protein